MNPEELFSDVVEKYSTYVNPGLSRLMAFAGFGVEMRGEGCYIYDQDGKHYLDCLGGYGVFSLGHRHPKVVEAVRAQLDTMPLSGKAFFNKKQADLAEKLFEISPEGLQYTFFSNSGTEAVEAALKFAKGTTGRSKIISTNGSYHGKTIGALSTTGRQKYQTKFMPLMPGVEFVDYGDADAIVQLIDDSTAAVIIETVQGEGGIIVAPPGYLTAIRTACTRHGALMIVDEVQTGFARTGKMFGCDHEGIQPDILTMAKCLGGGVMPIGATMGTQQVWDEIFGTNPMLHTSTFGGNALACSAGLAAIEVIKEEGLVDRSHEMGAYMRAGLESVRDKHPDLIKEVRGQGLMIGVEFTQDDVGELTIAQMLIRNMVAAYTLNNPRVMRFEPPLIITKSQIDDAVEIFDASVTETKQLLVELVG